jgi:hypothetical protein
MNSREQILISGFVCSISLEGVHCKNYATAPRLALQGLEKPFQWLSERLFANAWLTD